MDNSSYKNKQKHQMISIPRIKLYKAQEKIQK